MRERETRGVSCVDDEGFIELKIRLSINIRSYHQFPYEEHKKPIFLK